MDVLEHPYSVLSVIIEALKICNDGRDYSRSSRHEGEWGSELRFCFGLQSTIEDIIAWHPQDANFAYEHELSILVHAVSHHLEQFCDVLAPYLANLQDACQHFDQFNQDDAARLELQLRDSIAQPVKTLRKQVYRYIPAVNTLLLLYIIAVLKSPPLEAIPEDQIVDIKSIGQRGKIIFAQDLQKSLKSSSNTHKLAISEQQSLLNSLKRDAERYWESVQLTICKDGVWSEKMEHSEEDVSSSAHNRPKIPAIPVPSSHRLDSFHKHRHPSFERQNWNTSGKNLRKPVSRFPGIEPGRSTPYRQSEEYLDPSTQSRQDRSYAVPAFTDKSVSSEASSARMFESERYRSSRASGHVTSSTRAAADLPSWPTNPGKKNGHGTMKIDPMAVSRDRPSAETQSKGRLGSLPPTLSSLRDGQFRIPSHQESGPGNRNGYGANADHYNEENSDQQRDRPQQFRAMSLEQGGFRQENQHQQSSYRPLQSQYPSLQEFGASSLEQARSRREDQQQHSSYRQLQFQYPPLQKSRELSLEKGNIGQRDQQQQPSYHQTQSQGRNFQDVHSQRPLRPLQSERPEHSETGTYYRAGNYYNNSG